LISLLPRIGVGTDLALKSLEPVREKISGCVMATCCHGACNWEDYVGRDNLRSVMTASAAAAATDDDADKDCIRVGGGGGGGGGFYNDDDDALETFGRDEFLLLRRWSSGAVNTRHRAKEEEMISQVAGVVNGADASISMEQRNNGDNEHESGADPEHLAKSSRTPGKDVHGDLDTDAVSGITSVVSALKLRCGPVGLGRACQRLIDYGRREYIARHLAGRRVGSKVELLSYVPLEQTLQNTALVASL